MNTNTSQTRLYEYRVKARRLLKQLRSGGESETAEAAARFRKLGRFEEKSVAHILDDLKDVQLKHALSVVALEQGYESWVALKRHEETKETPSVAQKQARAERTLMYEKGLDVLLNRWFARYEDARKSLEKLGGFLFPYKHQFFVCEEEGIRILGLDPDDPDWERIDWDWSRPRDQDAWKRLEEKRSQAIGR